MLSDTFQCTLNFPVRFCQADIIHIASLEVSSFLACGAMSIEIYFSEVG